MVAVFEVFIERQMTVRVEIDVDENADVDELFTEAEDKVVLALEDQGELPDNMIIVDDVVDSHNVARVN